MSERLDNQRAFCLGEQFATFKQCALASKMCAVVEIQEVDEAIADLCFNFCRDNGLSVYSRQLIGTDRVRCMMCPCLSEIKRDDLEEVTLDVFRAHCNRLQHQAAQEAAKLEARSR